MTAIERQKSLSLERLNGTKSRDPTTRPRSLVVEWPKPEQKSWKSLLKIKLRKESVFYSFRQKRANRRSYDDETDTAKRSSIDDPRLSADEMDERRKENVAYEYLCHLEEAKVWIEACINETLPPTTELEEGLRHGVFLAKLAHFISPQVVPLKKIYDPSLTRFQTRGLHFKHTDNINHWLKAMDDVGFPRIFWPEVIDVYDCKNVPRAIYCIHALSLFLFRLGKAPQIQDLYGKIKFTDAEINAMRLALEKYGIQMPAFSKIGGILASEMPVDEAALHAAIIAINDAIDKGHKDELLSALKIPIASLVSVDEQQAERYLQVLYDAKVVKTENAHNKSMDPDSSYIPDVYDELLTQAELQGYINLVNCEAVLVQLWQSVSKSYRDDSDDAKKAWACLGRLQLRDVRDANVAAYVAQLRQLQAAKMENNNGESARALWSKDEVQAAILATNVTADHQTARYQTIRRVNEALCQPDANVTFNALNAPQTFVPVVPSAAPLYHSELAEMRNDKQEDLDFDEINAALQVIQALAAINEAVDKGISQRTYATLLHPDAHIDETDEYLADKYQTALRELKDRKSNKESAGFLTHFDIQSCISDVNQKVAQEHDRVAAVQKINDALETGDAALVHRSLHAPAVGLHDLHDDQQEHYFNILTRLKNKRAKELQDPHASVWYEEIVEAVELANEDAVEGRQLSTAIAAINAAVASKDNNRLVQGLRNRDSGLFGVMSEHGDVYMTLLLQARADKQKVGGEAGSGWMVHRLKDGFKYFYNVHTGQHAWSRPAGVNKDNSLLTRDDIQAVITDVTNRSDRERIYQSREGLIISLQARIRGLLARRAFRKLLEQRRRYEKPVVKLQTWWRMVHQRNAYREQMDYYKQREPAIIQLQAQTRAYLARKHYLDRLRYFVQHIDSVIKIQTWVRANRAKKDYRLLMHSEHPAVGLVRKFVHMLDVGDQDYTEEIELQRLKQQVVADIRTNKQLEDDLALMDIKIGLLVKNRITLQDVISQNKTLKDYRENTTVSSGQPQGLKALSRQSHERLEAYQHLFYELQTNPIHLAKLVFVMQQNRSNKFLESVILTLFNYAANQRDEYLLLRLFRFALEEEIRLKVDQLSDIVSGNPMVVKLIVNFNRNSQGQGALRDLLNPLVTSVLDDRNLLINTNPVEVYKKWINDTETATGQPSQLPYDVTVDDALKVPEVLEILHKNVADLQTASERFFQAILSSPDKIPYAMRYMSKVMKEALAKKFPQAPEKEILKVIGSLVYYRYINAAIVAPDAFDVIDVQANQGLTSDQRRNLGSVAKILQFASANKGFGPDSPHLVVLNNYIMDAHSRFKKYLRTVCEVEEPEAHFDVDQYTDVARISKPSIIISLGEIVETHKLLLEHQMAIAPDQHDRLHELLDDLGDVPDLETLVGDRPEESVSAVAMSALAKTEVTLVLSNKFSVAGDNSQPSMEGLLARTKRMVVDIIRCQTTGDTLSDMLTRRSTDQDEARHQALIRKREATSQKAGRRVKLERQQSYLGDCRLPMEVMKSKVRKNLEELAKYGLVTPDDNYQSVVDAIAKDIRSQRHYRQFRRQEMARLGNTLKALGTKRAFFEQQIDFYSQYVKTCVDNLSAKGGRRSVLTKDDLKQKDKQKSKPHHNKTTSVKYSAAKLHDRGVVLEIEGLPTSQFRNVLFEIISTENPGVFDVNAKFMGVAMEKVELVFQDLLQLQYEGVAVMKMFDKAKVNVNLLIFLLNKKFYGKK